MKTIFILLFCLNVNCLFAQISSIILDDSTTKVIEYVNIWVEGKDNGTTSDRLGNFRLDDVAKTDIILFSAIGYETKRVKAIDVGNEIRLQPSITVLDDVIISPIAKEIRVSKFKKRGINWYFGGSKVPKIVARYFKYEEKYFETPYLKAITFLTKSQIDSCIFSVRLYSVNNEGKPYEFLHSNNIICRSNKGNKKTVVELSDLNIKFPLEGFFVAVEWLIVDENRYISNFFDKQQNKEISIEWYSPSFGALPFDSNKDLWLYGKGKWMKPKKNMGTFKNYARKYSGLAVELELEN